MISSIVDRIMICLLKEMREIFPAEMQSRAGGHLTVWFFGDSGPMISSRIDLGLVRIDQSKWETYAVNSAEKASRLIKMAKEAGHISSWQSRDFDNKKYGGAIAGYNAVFSFSGLPEKLDEYLMARLAYRISMIDCDVVAKISEISDNEYLRQLNFRTA